MNKNLISVGQLEDRGHSIHFRSGEWKVTKEAMVITQGNKISILYMTINPSNMVDVVEVNDDASLLYNKLGHMSHKVMKELLSKEKLPELKLLILTYVKVVL